MTADEWLADLEDKAKAYKSSSTYERLIAKDEYFAAANPAVVLRLVNMVRILGNQLETLQQSPRMNCYFGSVLEKAYVATEKLHG